MTTSASRRTQTSFSSSDEIASAAILLLATAVGAYIRLHVVLSANFPINDGGLFYTMTQDIVKSSFALPAFSSYNAIHMPFAYPPLGFYVAALLNSVFKWPLIDIVHFFPAVVNILTIPAFYLLSRTILKSRIQSAVAVFVFAMLPRSFRWFIMGGGLTRSLGFFFAILALQQAYLLYTTRNRRYLLPIVILAGLTLLTHPEMALYLAASCAIFFLFYWRNREGLIMSLWAGLGVLLMSSPWWLTIVSYHGFSPLLAAFQTGEYGTYLNVLVLLITGLTFAEQAFLGFIGLLGIATMIAQRKIFLPIWLFVLFLIDPRGAPNVASAPLAMISAVFIDESILSLFQARSAGSQMYKRVGFALLVIFLISYGYIYATNVQFTVLSNEDRNAMSWVAQNTPTESQFAVITRTQWAEDMVSEWFPVLTERQSLTTVQGFEWFPGRQFFDQQKRHDSLQVCLLQGIECLQQWATTNDINLTYIYLEGGDPGVLGTALAASPSYELVYGQAGSAQIFRHKG